MAYGFSDLESSASPPNQIASHLAKIYLEDVYSACSIFL